MKDFTSHALNIATTEGARYADVRIIDHREQVVSVKNGNVDGIGDQFSQGFGVRVLLGDSWGFASSAYLDKAEIERIAAPPMFANSMCCLTFEASSEKR